MTRRRKLTIAGVAAGILLATLLLLIGLGAFRTKPLTLQGTLITRDADTRKQLPIANAAITVTNRLTADEAKSELSNFFGLTKSKATQFGEGHSDASGLFSITLPKDVRRGRAITFEVRHADYRVMTDNDYVGDQLYVLRMEPIRRQLSSRPSQPEVRLSNVLVRYSIKATATVNIGSAARTFEVVNTGNVPCKGHDPCSPDGKWKAAVGSITLDAGNGNEFQNARASCIAGPCPFTKVDDSSLARGGRSISVSARNWSDTAVFLIEAEVVRHAVSDTLRESHPFVLGQALSFTIPSAAEGVSIQAEMNGETIVFPLGPALLLSWAECNARVENDKTRVYRCELKPEYRFR